MKIHYTYDELSEWFSLNMLSAPKTCRVNKPLVMFSVMMPEVKKRVLLSQYFK